MLHLEKIYLIFDQIELTLTKKSRVLKKLPILLLSVFALSVFVTSCKKDDDDHDHDHDHNNVVTIVIQEPADNGTIARADCASVHIHVDFAASDELHEVEVELHPEGDESDKIIDFDRHTHDPSFKFEQDVDLCAYPAGTKFHLHVESYVDHDGEEKVSEEVEFTLQ